MTTSTETAITIRVLCFAQLRARLGQSTFSISLPAGATGRDLVSALRARHSSAAPLLGVSRLAVNCEYVTEDVVLHDGDEVAVITPVSGG